jgi:hypothetical protein
MRNLSNIQRPSAGCNKEVVIRIESYSSCYDNMTQQLFSGANGFKKILNLRGYIRALPREIQRTISFNCRTQKVRSSQLYLIQSSDAFPEWKAREIEDMFSLETIIVDGYNIVHRGGTIFEKINNSCPTLYRLNLTVEECAIQQIHGCDTDCSTNKDNVYVIPDRLTNDIYYNSQGKQIASNFAQLLDWFAAQTGVTEVEEVSIQLDCFYYKVFRVKANGAVPSFFYFDEISQGNKVVGQVVNLDSDNLNQLCNGVNNNACGYIMLDTPTVFEMECGTITLGTPDVFKIGEGCGVEAYGNWTELGSNTITSVGTSKTMDISLQTSVYVEPPPPSGTTFSYTSTSQSNCSVQTDIPSTAIISEVRKNGTIVSTSNWSFNTSTLVITLSGGACLNTNDDLEVDWSVTSFPSISETIARITGVNCQPKQMYVYTSLNNPDIPVGSSLVLYPNGEIKWVGIVPYADGSGSEIGITNIYYETN